MSDKLKEKFLAGLSKIHSHAEVVAKPLLVPCRGGLDFWFFKKAPGDTPTEGCTTKDGMFLLFIGCAPGTANSPRTLYDRIYDDHCDGSAGNSTLRESLGVLLLEESCDPLQRTGKGSEMTFTPNGERWLNRWMDENAFVCWYEHKTPWKIKKDAINALSPPLNIRPGAHKFKEFRGKLRDRRNEILGRTRKSF